MSRSPRHVLACSAGLEVIELSSPAEHETRGDLEMTLPTPQRRPERRFGGQRFVHHRAAEADWRPWRLDGWSCRALGIMEATDGLARVEVARPTTEPQSPRHGSDGETASCPGSVVPRGTHEGLTEHDGELRWIYVLSGAVTVDMDESGVVSPVDLGAGDAVAIPAGMAHGLRQPTSDLELLEFQIGGSVAR